MNNINMNIYQIKWISSQAFNLCAVVIAKNEIDALKELDLEHDISSSEKIESHIIGECKPWFNVTQIVCRECL